MSRAKLTRALMRGGVAERHADGAYRVWRSRNRTRRALGVMRRRDGDALRADGKITLLTGETALYGWAGEREEVEASPLPPQIVLGDVRPRRRHRALLIRALDGAGDARERERLSDTLAAFLADCEQAAAGQRITMNWHSLASGRADATSRASDHLPGYARARAAARLDALAQALGDEVMQQLHWAAVQEISGAEFARRLSIRPDRAPGHVAALLCQLADAYDAGVGRGGGSNIET